MSIPHIPDTSHILALETSTPVCSVALYTGQKVLSRTETGVGIHSEKVFLFIEELLAEAGLKVAEINHLVVSGGPGSFTGLRIASSAVKGLLFGLDIPLYSCQTLPAIASCSFLKTNTHTINTKQRIHAVINARRTHLYHQLFEIGSDGVLSKITDADILTLEAIQELLHQGDVLCGTGIQRLDQQSMRDKRVHLFQNEKALMAENLIRTLLHPANHSYCSRIQAQTFDPVYQVGEEL